MNAARTMTIGAVVIGIAMATSTAMGIHWNATPSMPMGLWRVQSLQSPIRRGDVVTLCPPSDAAALGRERGYLPGGACPGDAELLIKTVAAVPGDEVGVGDDGISVNGRLIPSSAALPRDDAGRTMQPVPRGAYDVGSAEVWVIGGSDPRSFDSRYFGAVPLANLRGRAAPIFVSADTR